MSGLLAKFSIPPSKPVLSAALGLKISCLWHRRIQISAGIQRNALLFWAAVQRRCRRQRRFAYATKPPEITMLSEEKELPYDRPMLTKNLFGAVSGGAIASVSAKWYQENRINLQMESRVAALDAEKKRLSSQTARFIPSISASCTRRAIALCRPSRAMICRR